MGQEGQQDFQAIADAARTAWQVDEKRTPPDARHAPGQNGAGQLLIACPAQQFGQAGASRSITVRVASGVMSRGKSPCRLSL